MAAFTRNVLTGLITTVPIVLTFYLLYWLVVSAEAVLGALRSGAQAIPDETEVATGPDRTLPAKVTLGAALLALLFGS